VGLVAHTFTESGLPGSYSGTDVLADNGVGLNDTGIIWDDANPVQLEEIHAEAVFGLSKLTKKAMSRLTSLPCYELWIASGNSWRQGLWTSFLYKYLRSVLR
jgi:hypothetical protein